jgi:hypothetical protein
MANEEKQRALYMDENTYKIACKDAKKYNCSFSKYINELVNQVKIEKEVKLKIK